MPSVIDHRRALVVGYFSTFGDLETLSVVQSSLETAGIPYDISPYWNRLVPVIEGSRPLVDANPEEYSHIVVCCGPYWPDYLEKQRIDLGRFDECFKVGVNLSLVGKSTNSNPFDAVIARDGPDGGRLDLSIAFQAQSRPVVGLCFAGDQGEYGSLQDRRTAELLLRQVVAMTGATVVPLDTNVSKNSLGLRDGSDFEAVCGRLDAVLTTRLHGMVLALKAGTPVVALDAVVGGAKLSAQSVSLDWPESFVVDQVTEQELSASLRRCLAPGTRDRVQECMSQAEVGVDSLVNDLAAIWAREPRTESLFELHSHSRARGSYSRARSFALRRLQSFLPLKSRFGGDAP